ncbi:MAG: histidinol-phosphate aminotransferase [Candidatus Scalindua rubra]|uniref:Histidinol-phosphate aminotransferase n=1 Tax=Candidatus Scalindua rubra TaxID=1872076 RepID=A0A1E3X9T5_9BACT|nr:MAG: histidinol-phosphate aminotransferase [Candidatus Scalindua rubra]
METKKQSNYFRKNINKMRGYIPGEQPQDGVYIKLNTNENPYSPSPKVLAALKDAVNEKLRLYPDPSATSVKEKVAKVFGTKPERVMVGNGSDELLTIAIRCFVGEGDVVVYPYPTYLLYKTLSEIQEAKTCIVDYLEDYSLPEEILVRGAAVTFICNPNSPSGTMIPVDKISNVAGKIDGILVIDEAYVDFANDNCLRLVDNHPNLIVLRTLSKSYSLAGMRLGFAIAQEELIDGLVKVKDSYNVDRLSMTAAITALDDQNTFRENVTKIKKTRERLIDSLKKLEFFVYPSQANFVMIRCLDALSAKGIYQRLKEQKILIRYIEQPRLEDCLRITVGTDEEINALLEKLAEIKNSLKIL